MPAVDEAASNLQVAEWVQGTPSSIIIDKQGIVRHKLFGSGLGLEKYIEPLLNE